MQSPGILSIYESILSVTSEMLEAARGAEWDRLIERERACRILVEQLKQMAEDGPLDDLARRRKAEIIRKVLADDAEIRNITEPELARLSEALGAQRRERSMHNAYGGSG
jgi:flagellar protein FliT